MSQKSPKITTDVNRGSSQAGLNFYAMKKIYKAFIIYKEFYVELQLLIWEEWELTAWVTEIRGLLNYQMQQSGLTQCFPNRLFVTGGTHSCWQDQ